MTLLAITDHDVLPEPCAQPYEGLREIPGIELTAQWNGSVVHVVGLGFREHAPHLTTGVARQHAAREARAEKIAIRLQKRGIEGALAGASTKDAFFVRCGLGDTMTQDDIDRGMVIAIVGFAPLKPAEFVIVRIQQKVGQS